jgi:glycosyltransferase involved in cell wall biosynthesis
LAGQLTGDSKWSEFESTDVFCFPSHYESESSGLVIIEAMQFGIPVIASRWRGIPEIVQDGRTGFLIPPHDPNALAQHLKVLVDRPELRLRMGNAARQAYLERHTINKYLETIEMALLTVTNSPTVGSSR